MGDRCDLCGQLSESPVVLGDWWADGTATELVLCESCSDVAFPGLRQRMRHNCPICSAQDSL